MSTSATEPAGLIYIISDLHLGGEAADGQRGFRLCTHEAELAAFIDALTAISQPAVELVINGDIVDFLAERTGDEDHPWSAFHFPQSHALDRLNAIIKRSAPVFHALARFLAQPHHRLVILPGNHDLELNLPAVRHRLREAVGGAIDSADYEFILDGKAYRPGNDVLIEHGNRVDQMNFADYKAIGGLCELLTQGKAVRPQFEFDPPAGSKLVAQVMNRIKSKYSFIDLLKPEVEAAFPVILALEPGRRGELGRIALMLYEGKHRYGEQQQRRTGMGTISALESLPAAAKAPPIDPLGDILERTVGRRDFAKPPAGGHDGAVREIALIDKARSLWSLLSGKRDETFEDRLFDLRDALLAFQGQNCFDRSQETLAEYRDEAQTLARHPVRHVVFGHTHLAKHVTLEGGGQYFNSGTWADLLELPRKILDPNRALLPLADLEAFVRDMVAGNFASYDMVRPTYVRIAQDAAGNSLTAKLCDYKPGTPVL